MHLHGDYLWSRLLGSSGVLSYTRCAFCRGHQQIGKQMCRCAMRQPVLCCAVLCCAVLCCAVLCCAVRSAGELWAGLRLSLALMPGCRLQDHR